MLVKGPEKSQVAHANQPNLDPFEFLPCLIFLIPF